MYTVIHALLNTDLGMKVMGKKKATKNVCSTDENLKERQKS